MTEIEVRELRWHARDLVRRAEAGETITVTFGGRDVAQLAPIRTTEWRRWTEVADLFDGSTDDCWLVDRSTLDHDPADPFER